MEMCVILYNTTKVEHCQFITFQNVYEAIFFSDNWYFVQCTFSKVSKHVYNLMSSADKELPQWYTLCTIGPVHWLLLDYVISIFPTNIDISSYLYSAYFKTVSECAVCLVSPERISTSRLLQNCSYMYTGSSTHQDNWILKKTWFTVHYAYISFTPTLDTWQICCRINNGYTPFTCVV